MSKDRLAALDLVLELTVLMGEDMRHGLAELGLSESRVRVLWLVHQLGPSTQRAVADGLEVTPRTVTTLVDALVDTGFLSREPHPTDRRATLVTLTGHGTKVAEGLVDGRTELAGQLFDHLPGSTYDGLVTGLRATVERLRTLIDETGRSTGPGGGTR